MKKITIEESKEYFQKDEDYTGAPLKYFTLTPNNEGGENVNYFTSRKKRNNLHRGNGDQWVYIMSNPMYPNCLKIGYTKNSPEQRAKQLSSATGIILPFEVEWAFQCFNGENLEHEVHNKLSDLRINHHREFFDITLNEAKDTIKELGKNYT
jgi:hypothetical protein